MLQLEVQSEWDVGGGRLKVAEVSRENFFFMSVCLTATAGEVQLNKALNLKLVQ